MSGILSYVHKELLFFLAIFVLEGILLIHWRLATPKILIVL